MLALCWITYKDMFDRKTSTIDHKRQRKERFTSKDICQQCYLGLVKKNIHIWRKHVSLETCQQDEIKTARVGSFNKSQSEKRQHLLICEAAIW